MAKETIKIELWEYDIKSMVAEKYKLDVEEITMEIIPCEDMYLLPGSDNDVSKHYKVVVNGQRND